MRTKGTIKSHSLGRGKTGHLYVKLAVETVERMSYNVILTLKEGQGREITLKTLAALGFIQSSILALNQPTSLIGKSVDLEVTPGAPGSYGDNVRIITNESKPVDPTQDELAAIDNALSGLLGDKIAKADDLPF